MFCWRGFSIEERLVQRSGPFDREREEQDQSNSSSSSEGGDAEEEEVTLEISPEWRQRIVVAHNAIKARQHKRKLDTAQVEVDALEQELKQGFDLYFKLLQQQQQPPARAAAAAQSE